MNTVNLIEPFNYVLNEINKLKLIKLHTITKLYSL